MASQIVGYRYFTNFLLFIGNPIEKMLGINFDKRGWLTGRRVSMGENGTMIYLHAPNLYGENEGGVSGTLCFKQGTNNQYPDASYKKYMESIGSQASGYPFQSYISFGGGELLESLEYLTDEQLQALADQYNDGVIPGNGFYVGNSGYMKEMLLWVKRTRVRNDGRRQWYETRADGKIICEIDAFNLDAPSTSSITKILNPNTQKTKIINVVEAGNVIDVSAPYTIPDNTMLFSDTISSGLLGNPEPDMHRTGNLSLDVQYKLSGLVYVDFVVRLFAQTTSYQLVGKKVYLISEDDVEISPGYPIKEKRIKCIMDASVSKKIGINVEAKFPKSWGENTQACFFETSVSISKYNGEYDDLLADGADINPIHKIREILTDDTAMNKPESSVNNENFIKAADRIYAERLGISWSITEKSCIDAINELCYHIEAGIRVNRQTGLYEVILFRDDWFEEDEIHSISESKIKSIQYEITNADEVINQVNVNFYDRTNIKNSSFSISESGLIQTLGRVNAETLDFPYFMNMRNAEIVANWKLKLLSTGVYKGTFTTGWREARKWNRYDLIKLPWSKRWNGTVLVRIMSINLGGPTNNEVSIDFIEVVPSTGMMNTTIVADDAIDTRPQAPQPCTAKVFELPYFEAVQSFGEREVNIELTDNAEAGYLCAIAKKPQNNSLNAALHVDSGNGYERVATINYCETAYLDQAIDRMSSTFVVKNAGNIASVRIGSQIFINDEIMVYQSYDAVTKVLTVKRGALETIPQIQALDSMLYFADDFVAVDQTIYVDSEVIEAKVLTTTPSGVLALGDALTHIVDFKARAIRPYPPANVKINGSYWIETHLITNDIILTWVGRNRLQQTGGEILGWYEGDVTIEDGVTYSYELVCENVVVDSQSNISANTVTILKSKLLPNKPHALKIWSVRDGYDSYQTFQHSFFVESISLILTAATDGSRVTGNTVPVAHITVNVDESLKANMQFDGSSISGKAPAGTTITIEVEE